mgnify:CR=1 FL=1
MKTIIKIPTWRCACDYAQDFEPTQENLDLHFNNNKKFPLIESLKENECPSCHERGNKAQLVKETDPKKKTTITIMGEDEVDELVEVEDDNGKPKLVKSSIVDEWDANEQKKALEEARVAKLKIRKQVKPEIKQAMKEKINADIAKFKTMED